jgi:hypothetical protein
LDGVAQQPEHQVRCFAPLADTGGDEQLRFEIDGKACGITLKIGSLSRSLVSSLPDRAIDLVEIAAFVYAIDASISRGGLRDEHMAAKWYRRFQVELPVRELRLWSNPDVKRDLEETLAFLSGDQFDFTFIQLGAEIREPGRFFNFGQEGSWSPDTVMLFSGGLDSYAGALEEIIERKSKVALISHSSSTKIAPIQRALTNGMANKLGPDMLMHFPMRVQLRSGTNIEGSHRTRSFLFAAMGMVTAVAFGKDRIAFYENGVVSLNLPPVGNVLGTRATRTTHPQTLSRFGGLFSRIFGKPLRADNPFFWRTKTEVVETIARLGMRDQIAHTRSCADVHNQTRQYVHCGRCSQCIDRRFAVLACGLEAFDPEEAYRVDLMTGVRAAVQDKEVALSYLRLAFGYEVATPVELEQRFPAVLRAVEYLNEPSNTAMTLIADLLRRHGASVTGVMRRTMANQRPDQFPEDSLPYLYGDLQRSVAFSGSRMWTGGKPDKTPVRTAELIFDRKRKSLTIDNAINLKGATFDLLLALAEEYLGAAGRGLAPLDFPPLYAGQLCDRLGLETEEAVRRRVVRARSSLGTKFASAGKDAELGRVLIENLPGMGYRLAPDRVVVRMKPVA